MKSNFGNNSKLAQPNEDVMQIVCYPASRIQIFNPFAGYFISKAYFLVQVVSTKNMNLLVLSKVKILLTFNSKFYFSIDSKKGKVISF
jgi:hypothetical protein